MLEGVIEKTRSEQIKSTVHDLLSALQTFRGSREHVTKSFNAVVETVKKEEAIKSVSAAMQVVEPVKSEKRDMETQSPCWWDLPPSVGSEERSSNIPGPPWTEVVRKKKINKQETIVPPGTVGSKEPLKEQIKRQPRVRSRPPAILVDIKAEEFPELAKKIRGSVKPEVIGDSVLGMRQAKSGGLLIEVRGDQTRVEEVRAEISLSAGQRSTG